MNEDNKKTQRYCNVCLGGRRHTVLCIKNQHDEGYDPEDGSPIYHEDHNYILAECDGCEHITLFIDTDSSHEPEPYTTQYPPQTLRREPKWLLNLLFEDHINNPYKYDFFREIYSALRNNNLRLVVIGVRALLEQVMIEKVGDSKTFKKNMDTFQEKGFISRVQREAIDPVIEAGHASTHRGFKASKEEVLHLMDITENLIESIYINQKKSSNLKVPERKA